MAFLKSMGRALAAPGKALMNAPGMGAIRKPLQAGAPGLRGVGNAMGLGPSRPPQQQFPVAPPQGPITGPDQVPDNGMGNTPDMMALKQQQAGMMQGPPMGARPMMNPGQGVGPNPGMMQQLMQRRRPIMGPQQY